MARPPQSSGRSNRNGEHGDPSDAASVAESLARRGQAEDPWATDTPTGSKVSTLGSRGHGDLLASASKNGTSARLQGENEQLRIAIDEIRQRLNGAAAPSQTSWEDREREFETILEEKSEEIRLLYMQIQQLERKPEPAPANAQSSGDDSELNNLADELAQDQARLEEEREQLRVEREGVRQEEEDLEQRMQEMELQTSKSRADLVRQRNELHRQYNEVRAELEQAKQSGAVSDRVRNLEREAQELSRASNRGK